MPDRFDRPPELTLVDTEEACVPQSPIRVLHAAGSDGDLVRMTTVVEALAEHRSIGQTVVHAGRGGQTSHALRPQRSPVVSPDRWLGIDAPTHGARTALMLHRFERLLDETEPHLVVVYGATDAALACGLAAAKHNIALAHVEAGLRVPGRQAPTDVNRALTDCLADTLLAPGIGAVANVLSEAVPNTRAIAVGSTGVDLALRHEAAAHALAAWTAVDLERDDYVLVALHQDAELAGDAERLAALAAGVTELAARIPVVLPLNPRTREALGAIEALEPLARAGVRLPGLPGYLELLSLVVAARGVVTDLGLVQDDTSVLGVPCGTLADVTDRPVTVTDGTNVLLGGDPAGMGTFAPPPRGERPAIELWEGAAGRRAAQALVAHHVLELLPAAVL